MFDGESKLKSGRSRTADLDGGIFLSAGVRHMFINTGQISGHFFAQFDYVIEDKYKDSKGGADYTYDFDGHEISMGTALNYRLDNRFSMYAGISYFLLTDLSYEVEFTNNVVDLKEDGDLERDNKLGFRLGARYEINKQWNLRGEVNFGSEQAYILSVGTGF